MTSIGDILKTVFKPEPCDFCPNSGLVYVDPETHCRFCLDCLEQSTEPMNDPAMMSTGLEVAEY